MVRAECYGILPGLPRKTGVFHRRPLFDEAAIRLQNGNTFTIITHNNSRDNKYVRKIILNGEELAAPFFNHQDIVNGGTLELTMGAEPLMPDNELRK